MISAGIDAGSRAVKVVLFDTERGCGLSRLAADQDEQRPGLASELFEQALRVAGIERAQVAAIVATGAGRNAVPFAQTTVTEIICHAHGARHLLPGARTVIEIGAQDCKVIRLADNGGVSDFAMNDRCAAGTGRFLELLAERLGVELETLSQLSRRSLTPATITSTCVLFAEEELTELLEAGATPADLVAGVYAALAARVARLAGRVVTHPVCLTGGVALQPGMAQALEAELGCPIHLAPQPLYTGALGAALLAARRPRNGPQAPA